jgi:beta-galactosidase
VAHGADTVMFFQMRRSPGACEKFHGAVIDHAGREDTRVFRECAALGKELEQLRGATLGTRTHAKAAILFDWPTWWALECSAGPSTRMKYLDEILNYYRAFHEMNISVDFVGTDDDISGYQFVAAPLCYMVKEGLDEKLRAYAKEGGSLLFTYMSGYVNESDYITVGGYPGKLKDLCGIWVEEIDALSVDESNSFVYNGVTYPAELLCDLLHCEGAEELASYQADFYQGMPVVTKNRFGKGTVYYVGTRSNPEFYRTLITDICKEQGISPVLENAHGLEITERENENQKYIFVLNHQKEKPGTIVLPWDATELLGQNVYKKQTEISVKPREVLIFQVDK